MARGVAPSMKERPHPQDRPFISSFGVQGPLPGASKAGQEGATPDVLVNPGAGPRDDILNRRARKAPGPRNFFCCGVRLRAGRGALGYKGPSGFAQFAVLS